MARRKMKNTDIAVVGGGPTGFVCAILLARAGLTVRLFAPAPDPGDTRTSALLREAVELFEELGLWSELSGKAAPLKAMRLIDDSGRLLRAPNVTFRAEEIGEEAFGYNIANADLIACLEKRAGAEGSLEVTRETVTAIEPGADAVTLTAADGSSFSARALAGADGRNSISRKAAHIASSTTSYAQMALACNIAHSAPHDFISTEIHKTEGPLTFVPLPGKCSSIVWVCKAATANRLKRLDDAAFAETLRQESHALLGDVTEAGPRAAFPSISIMAAKLAANRTFLVGEAAHVLPPIGAQGLNLGLRDAAVLAGIVGEAAGAGEDIGGTPVLRRYGESRRGDIALRSAAVGLLNRSVLSGLLPLHAVRGAGLHLLAGFRPLRRLVMELGLEPPGRKPGGGGLTG